MDYFLRHFEFRNDHLPFAEAKASCEAEGGKLAEPRDDPQFRLVRAFSTIAIRFWLGGQDPNEDPINQDILFLSDGTSVPLDSGFWGPDEPNNLHEDEYCLEFLLPVNGLNDENCLTSSPFVCEFGAHGPNVGLC